MDLIVRFARAGLIHGDYNEFNILIRRETGEPVVIDFRKWSAQVMRTLNGISTATWSAYKTMKEEGEDGEHFKLDIAVEASGFSKKDEVVLQRYMEVVQEQELQDDEDDEEDEEELVEHLDNGVDIEQPGDGSEQAKAAVNAPASIVSPRSTALQQSASLSIGIEDDAKASSPMTAEAESQADNGDGTEDSESGDAGESKAQDDIRQRVAQDVSKQRARQKSKYHTRKSAKGLGRPKGSKAKTDTRVRANDYSGWD
ncbi:hypothetical protein BKA62DRAFT_767649 [Auriculariales sp. MPI-PUGE-AT-0066]|nr:hypothetical protein BKA62DRAFT_767649 [Auriculariales sp. MPI-PUGE-AT-0066]